MLKAIVDNRLFIEQIERMVIPLRLTTDHPIPSPLDSEALVVDLMRDCESLLDNLRKANVEGHPLALSMKIKGIPGGEVIHSAQEAINSLAVSLKQITRLARPGLKKRKGPLGGTNDINQWLADSLVDILDTYGVKATKYKGGALAKCMKIVQSAAGVYAPDDPCKYITIRPLDV